MTDSSQRAVNSYPRQVGKVFFAFFEMLIRALFRLVYGAKGGQMPPIRNVLLLESASSLALKIRKKKITSVEVLNAFICRIEEINPMLNCVVAKRFEDAIKEAKACDKIIATDTIPEDVLEKTKPFFGVPFTTKDCIAVKDMPHTSGLYARKDKIAAEDADTVKNLRNAGAIPIALTNIPELCMWWETYNTIYGRTSNPYDTNRIVGGSSGGEGCNQAAAGSAFGIGSDIGGSIRIPAFVNGIFGHKPSKFIISNAGQYPEPINEQQNSYLGIGPMCRRAEDLMPIFKLLVKKEARDQLKLDEPVDIKQLRYFYQESDTDAFLVSKVSLEIRQLFKKVTSHLIQAHKLSPKRVTLTRFRRSRTIWLAGMSFDGPKFDEQLTDLKGKISLPWELLKWCCFSSRHTFVGLATAVVEKFSPQCGSPAHVAEMEEGDRLRREVADLLGDDGVLFYPTHPTAALYHNESTFRPFNFSYTGIVNILGFPATHIPMGRDAQGLPIGLQVIANVNNDRLCMAVAREMEKAFGGWDPLEVCA